MPRLPALLLALIAALPALPAADAARGRSIAAPVPAFTVETGTIDRGIHQTAVLSDPAKETDISPFAPPSAWNGRLVYTFGGGCGTGWYIQGAIIGSNGVTDGDKGVLEDLMPLAEAKRLDLGVTTEADAHVHASELDLFVVVRNLVDNAIRYTPVGGSIDLSIATAAHVVSIAVQDSGPGIPADERVRVFDPFYRVLGNEATGSGLGLSIVSTVVQRLGGEVVLEDANSPTGGLRVTVRLPQAPA